jgi:hypothetical protein
MLSVVMQGVILLRVVAPQLQLGAPTFNITAYSITTVSITGFIVINDTFYFVMLSVSFCNFTLNVVILSVVVPSVAAPFTTKMFLSKWSLVPMI